MMIGDGLLSRTDDDVVAHAITDSSIASAIEPGSVSRGVLAAAIPHPHRPHLP
jgi:hypothetical protein